MYGQVSDETPKIESVQKTGFVGATRLWGRHILYNTHELYLGAKSSGDAPTVGSVEEHTPTLYSIVNG